jgi:hypothetical protein
MQARAIDAETDIWGEREGFGRGEHGYLAYLAYLDTAAAAVGGDIQSGWRDGQVPTAAECPTIHTASSNAETGV